MKSIFFVVVILTIGTGITHARVRIENNSTKRDTTIQPGKEIIEKTLIDLRDSIDFSILQLQKKRETPRANYKEYADKAYNELTLQRREIEKVIEEVVISNERTWDQNIRTRALYQIAERRKEYYGIINDIKKTPGLKP